MTKLEILAKYLQIDESLITVSDTSDCSFSVNNDRIYEITTDLEEEKYLYALAETHFKEAISILNDIIDDEDFYFYFNPVEFINKKEAISDIIDKLNYEEEVDVIYLHTLDGYNIYKCFI